MKRYFSILFLVFPVLVFAQLKAPSEFLGYEIGTQFSRHADVVSYFEHVSANSKMVKYFDYGKTNERRRLTYAVISSEENIANLEQIRTDNLKNIGVLDGSSSPEKAIVWLSYNVHGNEASSSEAAMNTVYKLITEHSDWLENTVIIMDPGVNPDGRDRYVNWYNQVKASPYNSSRNATEHNEPWPGGRPNHYLFDLNRDWVWASQVETQQRLKIYNQWMPQIHVDFHEQYINNPYYFAPGAEPYHEIISDWQREFQNKIGKNNAKYFDKNGWLFFTRESFDLLYPSYGDTYPLFMGAIGMTYEQAGHGMAGLGIINDEEIELTLVDRVAHHTTAGLSTIEVASQQAASLNSEFKKFFKNDNLKYKSFVLKGNPDNLNSLTAMLDRHEIKYGYATGGTVTGFNYADNKKGSFNANGALVVSTNQPKGKMVQVLFEPNAALSTPLTYDITAWSLPYAFGLEGVASATLVPANNSAPSKTINNISSPTSAGYIAKWNSLQDAEFLSALLKTNIKVRFSENELGFGGNTFGRGSLIITRSDNKTNPEFDKTVTELANQMNRQLYASPTSFADKLTDFGSQYVHLIKNKKVAMLQGEGTSSLSYGALWHFFETQLKYPITSINTDDIGKIQWSDYDVLILPDGYYKSILKEDAFKTLEPWINKGGRVIAIGNAVSAFEGKEGFDLKENGDEKAEKENDTLGNMIPYAQRELESTKDFITGSIYKVKLDNTHPLAFGYGDTYYSLKLGNDSYKFLSDGYNVGYIEEPESVSGFSGEKAKASLKNSIVFAEAKKGRGSVIYMVDDVSFRSFWQNGKLFLANAIFFGGTGN
ncbi:Zinc carboxypeptidase [Aequorivita sublithincola DSM 14238]|uniref:Zinc carboxypeptidase n=1 Tax=Aequorivita sublithincola (strain DSM 14238 / LMG 21431 / ACAM 643 / 9-3) TaxID=746697 RepID=I3YX65_AEQSU|nr:M14 family metallopeptidase [Aequorivita sublithincola]AFL81583.1 Zinc carboxypeptidase [Aequorivita sublithincola DSM 14238]